MFEAINDFRRRLRSGHVLIGPGINLTDPRVSEALADSADFLWIDLEHSTMSPEAMTGHLLAARAKRKPAVVRVTGSDTAFIKPVLDAGAEGIVVPQVRSVEEVRHIVDDCRYPPMGKRGFGPLVPSNYGRDGGLSYVERANAGVFVSVMLETKEALESIDEIVSIPGLDSIVIGPVDLSGSLGILGQLEHPRLVSAMEKIISAGRKAGIFVGCGLPFDPAFAQAQVRRGVQWLQVGGDAIYLVYAMDKIASDIRAKL